MNKRKLQKTITLIPQNILGIEKLRNDLQKTAEVSAISEIMVHFCIIVIVIKVE